MKSEHLNFSRSPHGEHSTCFQSRKNFIEGYRAYLEDLKIGDCYTVLVHGSYATGNINEFSDIDVLFIKRTKGRGSFLECDQERKIFRSATAYLHRMDPLMHHGIDLIDEAAFDGFDESLLPIDTLKKSVLILGPDGISVSPDRVKSNEGAKRKLIGLCESILGLHPNIINRTPYKLKCLVSVVLLTPVLLLQAVEGLFIYKRDAIPEARRRYADKLSFDAVDTAERIRAAWKIHFLSKGVRTALIPFELFIGDELVFQRVAGMYKPMDSEGYSAFLRECQSFARNVVRFANANG